LSIYYAALPETVSRGLYPVLVSTGKRASVSCRSIRSYFAAFLVSAGGMTETQMARRRYPWVRMSATGLVGIVVVFGHTLGAMGFTPPYRPTCKPLHHKRQGLRLHSVVDPPPDEGHVAQELTRSLSTVLSHSPARLGEVLEGRGRGKMVWKSLARGRDPFEGNPEVGHRMLHIASCQCRASD
jgi:hypothetical protein